MSSIARHESRGVKTLAVRGAKAQPDQQFLTCMDYQPYCFQQSDLDVLVSSGFVKVSGSMYIAQTKADLDSVLNTLDNLNDYTFDSEEYTAIDLGKTIRIGVSGGDNDVITMRLVKRTGNVASAGGPNHYPNVCYIVTGNRLGRVYNNSLYASVLGTTPNNRGKKPFLNNGGYNPCIVSPSTFESILSSTVKVSGSLYLAQDASAFRNLLSNLANGSNYEEFGNNELSSIDLGKTVRVGIVGGENDLLVFRLVKRTGNVLGLGSPNFSINVGYIAIASKVNQSDYEGATEVAVIGTSPNALEVKPQFLSNGSYNPYIFPEANLKSVFASCVNVSDSLYLANNLSQLESVCSTLNNTSGRDYLINNEMSSVDLGKTIRLGLVDGETDLITFASTKGTSDNGNNGDLTTGYVVVASKLSESYHAALYVGVLGSAPRDS